MSPSYRDVLDYERGARLVVELVLVIMMAASFLRTPPLDVKR